MNQKKNLNLKWIMQTAPVFILLLMLGSYGCKQTKSPESENLQGIVDSIAGPLMHEYNIPGLSIAITVNGEHSFFNYGVLTKGASDPVTNQTLFELGSISKTFTATLACLASENGKLNFSDPVSKYLPELHGTVFDSEKLYYLGTHTTGGLPLQLPDNITNEDQLMKFYKAWKPLYAPATQRVYSNASIGLLGFIVARSMKEPFDQAMTNHVFSKLNMQNTYYTVPANKMVAYAQGYNKADSPVRLNPGMLANEAYGIKSCTDDMIKFADANIAQDKMDEKLATALKKTHTGYFKTAAMVQDLIWEQYDYPVTSDQLLAGNSDSMIYNANPVTELNPHLAPEANVLLNKTGSTNGFASYIVFIPSKKIGIVIMANKSYPIKPRVEAAYKILSYLESKMKK